LIYFSNNQRLWQQFSEVFLGLKTTPFVRARAFFSSNSSSSLSSNEVYTFHITHVRAHFSGENIGKLHTLGDCFPYPQGTLFKLRHLREWTRVQIRVIDYPVESGPALAFRCAM
jgi:hypothetical protein